MFLVKGLKVVEIFSKKSLHILEDSASGVEVGDTKQVTL